MFYNSYNNSKNKKEIYKTFVDIFFQFLEFIKNYSNENNDFLNIYKKSYLLKKTNIRLFIQMWYTHISSIYFKQIMDGDIEYFLYKDYNYENKKMNVNNTNSIITECIMHMKELYSKLDKDIINIFVNYMQKLTYLSILYYK